MGYALFVTFDRSLPEAQGWDMCGKVLAHHLDQLDDIATHLELQPLTDMISASEDELADFLDESLPNAIEEVWFLPQVGLVTVNALYTFVQKHSEQFNQAPQLLEDLATVKQYLEVAEQHHLQFHFSLDI